MSREFHWVEGNYLHEVLSLVKDDRPITGEPVADAIRDLLIALAPLEYAVASHQACDSGLDRVVLESAVQKENISRECRALMAAINQYDDIVRRVLRDAKERLGGDAQCLDRQQDRTTTQHD